MKRGDIAVAASSGDYGKLRPWVIVQSDALRSDAPSFLACPLTSDVQNHPFRMLLPADALTGIRKPSEIMVEKLTALDAQRFKATVGRCSAEQMRMLDARLSFVLGLRG